MPRSAGLEEYVSVFGGFEEARPSSAPHGGGRSKVCFDAERKEEERLHSYGAKELWGLGFKHVCC